ncbi:unnamed protein product [Sphagnum balticum]
MTNTISQADFKRLTSKRKKIIKTDAAKWDISNQTASFTAWIPGMLPSKKNKSKVGSGKQHFYTDKTTKELLDGVTTRLVAERVKQLGHKRLAHFTICFQFDVCDMTSADPDGQLISAMDLLQDAGIIVNDNMRHARRGSWSVREVGEGLDGIEITIHGVLAEERR